MTEGGGELGAFLSAILSTTDASALLQTVRRSGGGAPVSGSPLPLSPATSPTGRPAPFAGWLGSPAAGTARSSSTEGSMLSGSIDIVVLPLSVNLSVVIHHQRVN